MSIRAVQFVSLILTALTFLPSGAHLLEYSNKTKLDEAGYMTVQQIYAGWDLFAIIIIAAIASNIWLAIRSRAQRFPATLASLSVLLICASLITFFIWIHPANAATNQWTTLPENLAPLREQWERTHAINGVITFLAFVATLASSLTSKTR